MNAIAPGFATHSSEYAYFFGFPPDYNLSNFNPTVPNVTSHLALSRGIVDKLVAYIATGDPNKAKGTCTARVQIACLSGTDEYLSSTWIS